MLPTFQITYRPQNEQCKTLLPKYDLRLPPQKAKPESAISNYSLKNTGV